MHFLVGRYCIRRDGNTLISGNSDVIADEKGDITVGGKRFWGTRGLWELLTRKSVNSDVITDSYLKAYKRILELTDAHLVGYEPGGDIQISRGSKYAKVISRIFPQPSRRAALRQNWTTRQRWSPY